MNNREAMQKAFESWAEKELLPLDRRDSEHYRYNLTNRAWAGWQAGLASQAQQTEKKQLSRQDILKVFYTLKDKDKHFPMIEREISSALGSQLFVYGWQKAVEFDIQAQQYHIEDSLNMVQSQAHQPTIRKAKPMSDADRELLKNEFYFANDGEDRDWSEQEAQSQQEPTAWIVRERSKRTGLISNEILVENKNHFRESEHFKYEFVPLYVIPPAPEGEKE